MNRTLLIICLTIGLITVFSIPAFVGYNPEIISRARPIINVDPDGVTFPLKHTDNRLQQVLYGKTGVSTYQVPRLDSSTHALESIDVEHHEIHGSSAYTACRVVTHGSSDSPNILITAPNTTKESHFIFQVVSDDLLTVGFYEAPDYSGGTDLTAYNRNRNSTNNATLALAYDATDTSGGKGTLIWTFKAGANKTVTASESARFEFILKQGVKYLLEGVGSNLDNITFLLDWYEHIDKGV